MPRKSISDAQRKALRDWYYSHYPRPRQKACIKWFSDTFKHQISQSTVSESLGEHYKHLDKPSTASSSSYRHRAGQWPLLESILFEWQKLLESKGGVTSGDI